MEPHRPACRAPRGSRNLALGATAALIALILEEIATHAATAPLPPNVWTSGAALQAR